MTAAAPPLHGFRVLDACDELAVYATRLLAEMGAEVVRLEPAAGDPMRRFPPLAATPTGGSLSLYYEHFNAGKRAVTFDRAAPGERERLLALAAGCHALVESGPPGALLSAWLGPERLRAACPALTVVTVTPFGQEGPYAGDAGGDLEIAARAGLLWLSGRPDGPPYRPGGEQTAHMAGLMAANTALMGIFHAQRTGAGAQVEVPAVFAATLATLQTANANYHTWHGRVPARRGMGPPFARHIYPAADGWVALTALPGQWDNLVGWLAQHDAAADLAEGRYQDAAVRIEQGAHINAVLEAFTARHPKQVLFEAAQRAGVAAAPVNTPADLLADPFLRERGFFRAVHHPELGRALEYPGPAARFAGRAAGPHAGDTGATGNAGTGHLASGIRHPASPGSSPSAAGWQPLAGVRVLDFTWMIAGPLGTRLLANYGAEVLKVESYNRVDRIRETGPHPDGPWSFNEDGSFNDVNLGKRSILLNVNTAEGRALAVRLAAVSDVVAANFTGNRMDRWNLGFADLVRVRPDLIFLNMPVFHGQGERARWGGIGTHVNALAGINAISGFADDPPFGLGPLYPDFSGNPFHATAAVLAALINRDRGAGAQMIELSQYESTVSVLGPALLQQSATGAGPARAGNHSDRACPHNVYPCAGEDRWCALSARTDTEFAALAGVLGRPEWAADPRFATEPARRAHEQALDALIGAATRAWERSELAARLQAAGVAAAPVNDLADLLADPWYRAEYFTEIAGPEGCVFTTHAEPARPGGHKHPVRRAPLLGEHTDSVLRTLLGLSQPEIDTLYAGGALG